jgi:hypothetical protein
VKTNDENYFRRLKSLERLVLLTVCLLFASLSVPVYSQTTHNISSAGTLRYVANIKAVTNLTLTGNIDARDIAFMRDSIPNLAALDLSGATIVEYRGGEGTYPSVNNYPANVMPQYSFYNLSDDTGKTSLTSINLPAGLTSIGNRAFSNCRSLKDINLPGGLTSVGDYAFSYCSSLTEINLPGGLTSIGSDAFEYCYGLTEINLPAGVTSIGSSAFYNCSSLKDINLPGGLTSIGSYAFGYCSSLTEINLPAGLTSIGYGMFFSCSSLTEITVPAGVTVIGTSSFSYCHSLTEINLPAGLTYIENFAFNGCRSLPEITIPSGVTSIEHYAFNGCSSLTEINLPSGVTSIGYGAFSGCSSLTEINLPAGLTAIEFWMFNGCGSLREITIPVGVASIGFEAFNGCSSLTEITLPAGLTAIGNSAFADNTGLKSITNLNPVPVKINSNVFDGVNKSDCKLTVPSSSVDDYKAASVWSEFSGNIKDGGLSFSVTVNNGAQGSVDVPSAGLYPSGTVLHLTATPAGGYSFLGWTSGGTIVGPNTTYNSTLTENTLLTAVFGNSFSPDLTTAGTLKDVADIKTATYLTLTGKIDARDIAFIRDSIPNLAVLDLSGATIVGYEEEGDTYTLGHSYPANEMPPYSFYNLSTRQGNTSLTSITLPGGVTSIGRDAFAYCRSLTEINLPGGLTSIGSDAFTYCGSLREINLPGGVTSIGDNVFFFCHSLTEITIPGGVTSIGRDAFYNCSSLTEINLPGGLTSIEDWAFANCSSLTDINLPDGLTSIGSYAFASCSSLPEITIPEGLTSIESHAFSNCSSLTEITIPEGVTSIGSSAFAYCSSLTEITLPEGVTSIGSNAFWFCSSLTEVNLPDGLTSIEDYAFSSCSSLREITIPEGVTSIGDNAFAGCSSLPEITIPEGVTSIGFGTFASCDNLTEITLPGGVTSIGDYAFQSCSSLPEITLPAGVTSIGDGAFESCSSLTEITLSAGLTSIGNWAFEDCSSLTDIILPAGLTSIGSDAFADCSSLTEITIPAGVTSIENGTFSDCRSLTEITLPEGLTSIGNWVFYNCSSLTEVNLPAGLTSIGDYAFAFCYNLKHLILPTGLTSVGYNAFINTGATAVILTADHGAVMGGGIYYTGINATISATPNNGYRFVNWTVDGGTPVSSDNPFVFKITSNIAIHAKFEAIVYNIIYNLDGGTNHAGNLSTYTIESPAITLLPPAREDYVFDFWIEGDTIAAGSTGDKTFTALWKYVVIKVEDIKINGTKTAGIIAVNDSVFGYTAQACDETSILLDLGISSRTNVTVNGATYTPGMKIDFDEGNLTTVEIAVEPGAGDNGKRYTLQIAAPLTNNALYYQRWSDVVAINQNPATNGRHEVSDVRWYKPDSPVDPSDFIYITTDDKNTGDYYAEIKTVETGLWHHVCAVIKTKSSGAIAVYPNPVSQGETVTVKLPASYVNGSLNIYDIKGSLMQSGLPLPARVNSIDVSELVPGIYLLHITGKQGESETIKIIKE